MIKYRWFIYKGIFNFILSISDVRVQDPPTTIENSGPNSSRISGTDRSEQVAKTRQYRENKNEMTHIVQDYSREKLVSKIESLNYELDNKEKVKHI